MENLPPEIKTLKRIKEKLDKLMSDRGTPVEIRANFLYDYIAKDPELKKSFRSAAAFSHFLREQYKSDILKQFIPNCRVDTSVPYKFQWFFFKDTNKDAERGKGIETIGSRLAYKKHHQKVIA